MLAGEGPLREQLEQSQATLTGFVADPVLEALYANALVLACVSEEEGYGFTPLEAVSRGTPAVVSDLPVFGETLGEGALRVPRGDAPALADALLRLEGDAALRERLVTAGAEALGRAVLGQRRGADEGGARGGRRLSRFAIVTVIHDSARELESLLASVERRLDPRPRVVVVDSGSRDGGAELARRVGRRGGGARRQPRLRRGQQRGTRARDRAGHRPGQPRRRAARRRPARPGGRGRLPRRAGGAAAAERRRQRPGQRPSPAGHAGGAGARPRCRGPCCPRRCDAATSPGAATARAPWAGPSPPASRPAPSCCGGPGPSTRRPSSSTRTSSCACGRRRSERRPCCDPECGCVTSAAPRWRARSARAPSPWRRGGGGPSWPVSVAGHWRWTTWPRAVTYGTRALARTVLRRDPSYDRAQLRALRSAVRQGISH